MAKQLQFRRGTTAENNAFTGAMGEPTFDVDTGIIHVHDGETQGGAVFIDTVVDFQAPTAENNYTWYRKYASGWVEQGGTGATTLTVVLPVEMADTHYTIVTACDYYSANAGTPVAVYYDKTTTGFKLQGRWNGSGTSGIDICWETKGMAAS